MIRRGLDLARRFVRGGDGAALAEFGMVAPVLLLIFAVVIDGGRIAWTYQSAAAGVRDAARMVARIAPDDLCPGGSVAGFDTLVTDIVTQSITGNSIFPTGATIVDVVPSYRCLTGYRVDPAAVVEVRAQIRIDYLWGGVTGLFGTALGPLDTEVFDQSRVFGR
ncbi:TadE/TadG family type IV pilus assembly protein [Sulfitobacter sabulilitoris]|uniref:Pilus assembly protein n=1 Tax=Sulfitobacter sabulilitoris TaxID=2562655 RepID=A0A5S3PK51_9RHOB|nr:TadE/TadG family type IV pilus assembly protein [Sulfitobacter sabulilitoris]TMM54763.1 pilus assembly protein [Sulfitobacter sabulilitoris]